MRERLTMAEIVNLDCLIVPKGVVLPAQAGVVVQAATIIEAVKHILDSVDDIPVIHISDRGVLDVLNRHATEFPLAIAVLDDVPGGEYDVVFNNYTHMMPAISIGEFMEASSTDDVSVNISAQNQMAGRRDASNDRTHAKGSAIAKRAVERAVAKAPIPVSISKKVMSEVDSEDIDLGEPGER